MKSAPDSVFPDPTIKLGADGSFVLKIPGFPDTTLTY